MPYNLKEIKNAKKRGIKISNGTKIFFQKAKNKVKLIIGITGTKGGGTTSTLIYKILKNAHKKVILAGNIRGPAINYLNKIDKNTIIVLELSSFQLQNLDQSHHIAVVLDIFPDHQDVHSSIKEYFNAKSNICRHQSIKEITFYFKNKKLSFYIAKKEKVKKLVLTKIKFKLFL